ncbi:MAG: hypothetical protein GXP14_10755 [Gammaproteobacteria bacterium]|nr:hypothetical protein [Gammaproteobacteria bacterium]
MSKEKKEGVNDWGKQSAKNIKAIQEAFQLAGDIPDVIREAACREGLSASDMCRKILDLPIETKKTGGRRLTVSLKPEDYEMLAERWALPIEARQAIRSRMRQDIESFYYQKQIKKNEK